MGGARLLNTGDIGVYRLLRAEMLLDSPWAFGSAPGEDRFEEPGAAEAILADPEHEIVVVDHPDSDGGLACSVGIRREPRSKFRHRATIWGVYTAPSTRGRGLARDAMECAIGLARSWDGVRFIGLSASARSTGAIALYESLGFVQWGVEPAATCIDGVEYDEVHLCKRL